MRIKLKPRYVLPALAAAGALLLWGFQAGVAEYLINRRGGDLIKVDRVEGGLAGGFRLYGVRIKTAAFSVYVRQAALRPALGGLLRGKQAVEELVLTGAVLKTFPGPAGPAAQSSAAGLPPGLEIKTILIEDGRAEFPAAAGGWNAVTGIAGRLNVGNGRVTAQSLRGEFNGIVLALNGEYGKKGLTASGNASLARPALRLRFDYARNDGGQSLRAAGRLKGANFRLAATLAPEDRWTLELASSGLPLSLARKDLPDLAVPASVKASGRYLTAARMTGSARFHADLPRGAVFEGTVTASPGSARLVSALKSPEARGTLKGNYSAGKLKGEWELASLKKLALAQGSPLSAAAFSGKGTISGLLSAPVLTWDVLVSSPAYGPAGAAALLTEGEVRPAAGPGFRLTAEVRNVVSGKRALGSARLKTEGTPAANTLGVTITSGYLGADLAGTSALKSGEWRAVWDAFLLRDASAWRLCGPFTTAINKAGYRLAGFCASDGKARAELNAGVSGGTLNHLELTISDFALESLETLRNLPLPPAGVVNARAGYVKGAEDGTLDFSADGLRLKGMDFGSLRLSGLFNKARVDVRKADWKLYDGLLSAAGTAAIGTREPDFHFVVTASTVNVAPLLVFIPELKADKIFLNGTAEIALKGSSLTNRGVIKLDSPQLEITPLGMKLRDLKVSARGEESLKASVTASARANKAGRVTAQGELGALGPAITINAVKLPFATPAGFSGAVNGALEFRGTWKTPALSGAVDFPECRFDLEQWRKSPPPGPRSSFYESLNLEVKAKSERNAWFRDPPNSIEAKGDLLLKKPPYNPLAIMGTVEALKGFYTYLGNMFTIDSGSLVFGGEVPPDPKVAVSATNASRGSPIKVYMNATGTFRTPKIDLTSDPAMEQRDIMSYLLTGRPLYEFSGKPGDPASQAGVGGSQAAAANIAASYLSQKAAGPLVRKLDIDVFNVRMTADRAADITVGRYLTTKLFVSYGQVLAPGGEKRVTAEYTITPSWSLEGNNSSQGNYVVDLLFKFGIR